MSAIIERFIEAVKLAFVGHLTVFSVLALLWMVLAVFNIVNKIRSKKNQKAIDKAEEKLPEQDEPEEEDNSELAAAITAAIAACLAAEAEEKQLADGENKKSAPKFRVVAFEKASGTRPWSSNGIK